MQQKRDNSTRNGLTDEVDHGEMNKKTFDQPQVCPVSRTFAC